MSAIYIPTTRLGRWWWRWRYHLSALLLILPIAYTPHHLRTRAIVSGESTRLTSYGPIAIGPWTVRLYDIPFSRPSAQGPAGHSKQIIIAPCSMCVKSIRAIFVRLGKPRSSRAYGALAGGGNPHWASAQFLIPPRTTSNDELWLTAEGWDGSVHQASIALQQASPSTATWLKNRRGRP